MNQIQTTALPMVLTIAGVEYEVPLQVNYVVTKERGRQPDIEVLFVLASLSDGGALAVTRLLSESQIDAIKQEITGK
jgi:hypothetical protein